MRIVGVRMRFGWLWVLLLSSALVVATADVAWAHVVVSPKEAPTDSYQKFTVSVPTEKDVPTTEVRIEVPEGFIVTGVQPVPDWRYEFEKERAKEGGRYLWKQKERSSPGGSHCPRTPFDSGFRSLYYLR